MLAGHAAMREQTQLVIKGVALLPAADPESVQPSRVNGQAFT